MKDFFRGKMHFLGLALLFLLTGCVSSSSSTINDELWDNFAEYSGSGYIATYFEESEEAFPNPMKGFRPGVEPGEYDFREHEYARVYKHYVKYTDLERSKEDTVQKIIDWSNSAWAGLAERNIKVIPRVVLSHPISNKPGAFANEFWPDDIPQPSLISRWTSRELEERLSGFVRKLGEAWDNDPRVAAVELGLWGYWGEHHLLGDGTMPLSMQTVLGDAFSLAFHNKKVMVRYPEMFSNYQCGFYWDSFALSDDSAGGNGMIRRNVWRTQMISGEVAYDWGNRYQLGRTPDETVGNHRRTNFLIGWIKKINASSLGWVSGYTMKDQTTRANAALIQKSLGYRFVINSVVYKKVIHSGEELKLGFKVTNIGSAPFYYQWPVEISLLDKDRQPLFREILDVDIRLWLPGETHTVHAAINVPPELYGDTYIIAFSVLDPSGNRPSLRFANVNYYSGGRTPVGLVGLGTEPEYTNLGSFNSLMNDDSLRYEL
jgi:hypothetical protein